MTNATSYVRPDVVMTPKILKPIFLSLRNQFGMTDESYVELHHAEHKMSAMAKYLDKGYSSFRDENTLLGFRLLYIWEKCKERNSGVVSVELFKIWIDEAKRVVR